jgi:hypothetical protein
MCRLRKLLRAGSHSAGWLVTKALMRDRWRSYGGLKAVVSAMIIL